MSYKQLCLSLTLLAFSSSGLCQTAHTHSQLLQSHMNKAQQDLRDRRPDLAIPEFEAVLAIDPHNLDAQANAGVLLYFGNDFAKAEPHLKAALAIKPDLWKLQALLGLAQMRLNQPDDARTNLATALPHLKEEKIQDEVGEALVANYSQTGDLEKAASTVSILLEAQPTNTKLLMLSYSLYSDIASRSMLTLALTAPDSAEMHAIMARELQQHGDETAAIANYRDAIQLNPKLPGVYYEFGILLYNSTDEKLQAEAASQFQNAIAENPHDEKSQLMLGEIAARNGDMKAAYDADSRAVELQPNDSDACTELAKVLIYMNQKQKARSLLEHAVDIDPSDYTAHYRLSTLDRQQGRPEDAKRELADYQKYKAMQTKLESIFHAMRVQVTNKPKDTDVPSK
ncbi:MAG: tetratricopeptide repeat protein [Acidobacteriaceae bacterium]